VEPGLFGGSELPQLARRDYVENSNNSYWLSNPNQPLTGFPEIVGDYDTPRYLRTRIALIMTQQRVDGTDGLGPAGFTLQDMQNLEYSDRQYGAQLVLPQLVSMCRSFPGGLAPTSSGPPMSVGDSCNVLAAWDGHENLDSAGDVLFRVFWEKALGLTEGPWQHPFTASDPVNTPYGLETADPNVQTAFGDALHTLSAAHIPYNVQLGTVQYVVRNGRRIPLHGGPGDPDGEFNAIYQDVVNAQGQDPSIGSSYIQAVTWHAGNACPDAQTIMTYSESTNPASSYYDDQTPVFSNKQWMPEYFCSSAVDAHTISRSELRGVTSST
jgi:acyl-homoserine-lactone acylase